MPPDFFQPLFDEFIGLSQAILAGIATFATIKFRELSSSRKREHIEREAHNAEIIARLEGLSNAQTEVKAQVKNSHGTVLRDDLDKAINLAQEARDNSTQALKIVGQIKDSLGSLANDFRESRREHMDFRERHNQSTEEIHDLNKRVNAIFSTINKENTHEQLY